MEQRYRALAEEIRLKASRLDWERSNYADSFEIELGLGTVIISNNEAQISNNPLFDLPLYSLRFLNERGETVYSIDSYGGEGDENRALLEDLYGQAFNTYMQTEDTYRSMIDDLSTK